MNKVILEGRLTADIELKTFNNGNDYCNFTVAVDRDYKNKDGKRDTDFINCMASGASAKFIKTYFKKGNGILVEGSWERTTTGEGENKRTYDKCHVDKVHFPIGGSGNSSGSATQTMTEVQNEDDSELPF